MRLALFFLSLFLLFLFYTTKGNFHLDQSKTTKLAQLLKNRNLTLHFNVRQQIYGKAILFTIRQGDQIWFRISTLTSPNSILLEFRLQDGRNKLFKIATPFTMNDNQFHKILLVINGRRLIVAHNCHRLLWTEDNEILNFGTSYEENQLWGELWSITFGDDNNGNLQMRSFSSDSARPPETHCPHLEMLVDNRMEIEYERAELATEAKRVKKDQNMEERIANLEDKMNRWEKHWMLVEGRVKRVELHQRGCRIDGKWYLPGNRVQKHAECQECRCGQDGRVHCGPMGCARLDCAHPLLIEGKCCPECGKGCLYNGQTYESGESFWPKQCVHCQCNNGRMDCEFRNAANCAPLDCARQETLPNQCCPVCVGVDHCATDSNLCDQNAICVSGRHSINCHCKSGFFGNGTKCYDVDECLWDEEARAQLGGCGEGTMCINVQGSFRCDCLPGYQKVDEWNCVDLIRI